MALNTNQTSSNFHISRANFPNSEGPAPIPKRNTDKNTSCLFFWKTLGERLCSHQANTVDLIMKDFGDTVKFLNFSDARKLCCNIPKIQEKRPNLRVFCHKDANGIANSEYLDQTAPLGAV